jgi:hypothetical protein
VKPKYKPNVIHATVHLFATEKVLPNVIHAVVRLFATEKKVLHTLVTMHMRDLYIENSHAVHFPLQQPPTDALHLIDFQPCVPLLLPPPLVPGPFSGTLATSSPMLLLQYSPIPRYANQK